MLKVKNTEQEHSKNINLILKEAQQSIHNQMGDNIEEQKEQVNLDKQIKHSKKLMLETNTAKKLKN